MEESSDLLELARCMTAYGTALHRSQRPGAARRILHRALDLVHECGSPVLMEQAGAALAASGGRRRQAAKTGVNSLTRAEYRVASLAAQGRASREIAAILYVHRRTVQLHLANACRKLGIADRAQLASVLAMPREVEQPRPAAGA